MMKNTMRQIAFAAGLGLALAAPLPLSAQGLFDVMVKVDDQVVTRFEIEQRAALLKILNAPGDPEELAREQLIDDRLKMAAGREAGVAPTQEELEQGIATFASRGNLEAEEFLDLLKQGGVERTTMDAFVRAGLVWQQLTNARFARQISVSEDDIDRAIDALTTGGSIQVLLSEIIIPLQPGQEEQIQELASQIAQIRSFDEFSQAAQRFSAAGSRQNGGRLDWLPITQLPIGLRPILLGLVPGETTDPVPLQGALAIFQLRSVAEGNRKAPVIEAVEYMVYRLPGGRSADTLAQAEQIKGQVDTCDDMYGVNFGKADENLELVTAKPADIPRSIALELAKLDEGEISTALTSTDGSQLLVLMICGRSPRLEVDTSREEVAAQLRNRQLESFANAYLEELRVEARITEK